MEAPLTSHVSSDTDSQAPWPLMAAASRKPLIELLLPFSVLGSRFSHVAFWVCVPWELTGQAWLAVLRAWQCPLWETELCGSPSSAGL